MSFWRELAGALAGWAFGEGMAEAARVMVAAAVVYLVALWITRTGKKRYLGRNTVFDLLLAFMLGSVLARAINGDAPLVATAVAGFVLIAMHWALGVVSVRTDDLGSIFKGRAEAVVEDGRMLTQSMRDHHLTQNDLEEAVRQSGLSTIEQVQSAHFERNGRISIVPKTRVRVFDVEVRDGVQTVRVEVYG